jgi:L-ascorbate metabolism protein UlaG (beta-lactamase superfamily)
MGLLRFARWWILFVLAFVAVAAAGSAPTDNHSVSVTWLGHACFRIAPSSGPVVVTDPFNPGIGSYPVTRPKADVVTVSHEHGDHNAVEQVSGRFKVVRGSRTQTVAGVEFRGIASYHDAVQGQQRGPNTIFVFNLGGITFCHLGDLGHVLTPQQVQAIGHVDVLMIPVGGYYTIDAKTADRVVQQLSPRVVLPMHYKTKALSPSNPISGVEPFISGKKNVKHVKGDTLVLSSKNLPKETVIYVFDRYG